MTTLIERLKAATGPDRELDAEIACAIRHDGGYDLSVLAYPEDARFQMLAEPGRVMILGRWLNSDPPQYSNHQSYTAPAYTASLDSAMTLVPEGMSVDLHIGPSKAYPTAEAVVIRCVTSTDEQQRRVHSFETAGACTNPESDGMTLAPRTPALALCIAALLARGVS